MFLNTFFENYCGLNSVPPQPVPMLESQPPVTSNKVILFEYRIFTEVVKLKRDPEDGSSLIGVLIKRGNSGTEAHIE